MNPLLKELMIEVGYACPEMAERAQRLAMRVVTECAVIAMDRCYTDDGVADFKEAFNKLNMSDYDEPTKTQET